MAIMNNLKKKKMSCLSTNKYNLKTNRVQNVLKEFVANTVQQCNVP